MGLLLTAATVAMHMEFLVATNAVPVAVNGIHSIVAVFIVLGSLERDPIAVSLDLELCQIYQFIPAGLPTINL